MTAGSLVLIALSSGTIFSCTVYLSRMALGFGFEPGVDVACICAEPHRRPKASRPRILMARLFVLVNTAAITGKTSFLIVEKSSVERMVGRQPRDLSTSEGV